MLRKQKNHHPPRASVPCATSQPWHEQLACWLPPARISFCLSWGLQPSRPGQRPLQRHTQRQSHLQEWVSGQLTLQWTRDCFRLARSVNPAPRRVAFPGSVGCRIHQAGCTRRLHRPKPPVESIQLVHCDECLHHIARLRVEWFRRRAGSASHGNQWDSSRPARGHLQASQAPSHYAARLKNDGQLWRSFSRCPHHRWWDIYWRR